MSNSVIDYRQATMEEVQQRNKNRKTKTNASFNNVTQESASFYVATKTETLDAKSQKSGKYTRGNQNNT